MLRRIKLLTMAVAAAAFAFGLDSAGALRGSNAMLAEARMALSPRPASGDMVFIAIDKRSLDAIGVWPWPRAIHAEIIARLVEAGAAEIALDIDFSAASSPEGDRALAEALEAAGGAVVLPVFIQRTSVDPAQSATAANLPLPQFRAQAWLAAVNVEPDRDGAVRRFAYDRPIEGERVPSMPALLSGRLGAPGRDFTVNYSIEPASVPAYSAIDLLEGRLDADALAGRVAIVGAHAVELGDNFSVPVYGTLPGAMIQILAAETLAQDAAPVPANRWALMLALAVALALVLRTPRLSHKLVALGGLGFALEVAGYLLHSWRAVELATAAAHLVLVAIAVVVAATELDLRVGCCGSRGSRSATASAFWSRSSPIARTRSW